MPHAILQAVAQLRSMYPPAPAQPFSKTLIGILVGTLLLAALFYVLERLFPEQLHQPPSAKARKPTRSTGSSTSSSPNVS